MSAPENASASPPLDDRPNQDGADLGATSSEATSDRPSPWFEPIRGQRPGLGRKLMRRVMRTVETWQLIEPGDRILVAISGGKDSYTLLDLLWQAKQRAPFDFDLIAVHLDQVQPGYDGRAMASWLEEFGAPFEILREDTYSIVVGGSKPGQTYCFL